MSSTDIDPKKLENVESFVLAFRAQSSPTKEAYVFFHGFPANRGVKNLDVASAVFEKTRQDAFLIHYRGLGNAPGVFSFEHSIVESLDLVHALIKERGYERINLVGHSWGGLIALNVFPAIENKAGRLLLLSPFTLFPDDRVAMMIINGAKQEVPEIFGSKSDLEILDDIRRVEARWNPYFAANRVNESAAVTIIQAKNDDEVPASVTKNFISQFRVRPKYIELDQDHSFTADRTELINIVLGEI